jgi:hypothetical protein
MCDVYHRYVYSFLHVDMNKNQRHYIYSIIIQIWGSLHIFSSRSQRRILIVALLAGHVDNINIVMYEVPLQQ